MRPSRRVEIRVTPRNQRWEVSIDGFIRPTIDWVCTRDGAIQYGFDRAIELVERGMSHIVVTVRRPDGTLEEKVAEISPAPCWA